jgi:hypothetical protein
MKTKIKIESIFGKLLFEHETEDNTIRKTLEEAVKNDANLRGANLGGANLGGANLGGANLGGAYLGGAYLGGANLGEEWGKLESVSDVLMVGPIGSRNGYTTIYHTDKGVFVSCGCFRGTLDEFTKKVEETHGDNNHARDYKALVEFVKVKYGV